MTIAVAKLARVANQNPRRKLAAAPATLRETGRQVHICPFDLRDTDGIPAWFGSVIEAHGRPDILVNVAGITRRAPAEDLTIGDWNDTGLFVSNEK